MKHNPLVVKAFWDAHKIPQPVLEYHFSPKRRWRFDYCWPGTHGGTFNPVQLALEVEGGVWVGGRHVNGNGFIKDMEKYNEAACLGWLILRVQPKDLLKTETANLIKRALNIL